MDNGPLHIRFRSIDLSGLLSAKDTKAKGHSSAAPSRSIGKQSSKNVHRYVSFQQIVSNYCPMNWFWQFWGISLEPRWQRWLKCAVDCVHLRKSMILPCDSKRWNLGFLLVTIQVYGPASICLASTSRVVIYAMFFFVALSFWRCIKPRCMAMPSIHSIRILGRHLKSSSQICRSSWCLPSRFAKLQFLDLTLATISTDCLLSLLSACRSLRKLSLETLPLNTAIFEWVDKNLRADLSHQGQFVPRDEKVANECLYSTLEN